MSFLSKAMKSGNPPKHMTASMKPVVVAGTPPEAISRPGGKISRHISDQVKKLGKVAMTKGMP